MISGFSPVACASAGTSGKSAGHTTPRVLEKKLITAPIRLNTTGTLHVGRLLPAHDARSSMVPAVIATLISIPTPQIIRIVFHGTFAMTSFCGARFIKSAIAENTMATRPTSILLLMYVMISASGRMICSTGKINTTRIMSNIRYRFFFCSAV